MHPHFGDEVHPHFQLVKIDINIESHIHTVEKNEKNNTVNQRSSKIYVTWFQHLQFSIYLK